MILSCLKVSRVVTPFNRTMGVRCLGITGPHKHLPLSKIVATIGPASENNPVLPECVTAGMRIMRLNFSHATYEEANLRMKNLKVMHPNASEIQLHHTPHPIDEFQCKTRVC